MMPNEAQMVFSYLMRRAATDMTFRRALLRNPKATLEQEFDLALPPTFNIRFVENHGADLTLVLPDPCDDASLSEADLEFVAGGAADLRDLLVRHVLRLHQSP